jgi:hypothetical protein
VEALIRGRSRTRSACSNSFPSKYVLGGGVAGCSGEQPDSDRVGRRTISVGTKSAVVAWDVVDEVF